MESTKNSSEKRIKIGDNLHKQLLRMRPVVASAIKLGCIEFRKETRASVEKKISPLSKLPSLDPLTAPDD